MGVTKVGEKKYRARYTKFGVRHNVGTFETKKEAEEKLAVHRGYTKEEPLGDEAIDEILEMPSEELFNTQVPPVEVEIKHRQIGWLRRHGITWQRIFKFLDLRKK